MNIEELLSQKLRRKRGSRIKRQKENENEEQKYFWMSELILFSLHTYYNNKQVTIIGPIWYK